MSRIEDTIRMSSKTYIKNHEAVCCVFHNIVYEKMKYTARKEAEYAKKLDMLVKMSNVAEIVDQYFQNILFMVV